MRGAASRAMAGLREGSAGVVALLGRQAAARPAARRVAVASARRVGAKDRRIIGGYASGYSIRLDHATKMGYVLGSSEKQLQAFVSHELSQGMVFYDLGANIGFMTLVGARAVGPSGEVVSFEPAPCNAATLRHNVRINDLSWVEVVEAAVSSASGTARFAAGDSDQSGHIAAGGNGDTRVATVSIDDWLLSRQRVPDMLKIDVEGAEMAVLQGAERLFSEHRPVVVCEIHDIGPRVAHHEVSRFLRRHGYATEWLDPAVEAASQYWAPHLIGRPSGRSG